MASFTYSQEGKKHSQLPGPQKPGGAGMPAEARWTGHCVRGGCLIRPAGGVEGGKERGRGRPLKFLGQARFCIPGTRRLRCPHDQATHPAGHL